MSPPDELVGDVVMSVVMSVVGDVVMSVVMSVVAVVVVSVVVDDDVLMAVVGDVPDIVMPPVLVPSVSVSPEPSPSSDGQAVRVSPNNPRTIPVRRMDERLSRLTARPALPA